MGPGLLGDRGRGSGPIVFGAGAGIGSRCFRGRGGGSVPLFLGSGRRDRGARDRLDDGKIGRLRLHNSTTDDRVCVTVERVGGSLPLAALIGSIDYVVLVVSFN